MRKTYLYLMVFYGLLFGSQLHANLKLTKELQGTKLKSVTIENRFIRAKIIRKGGRIISFVDKSRHAELTVTNSGNFAGMAKNREWTWYNDEPSAKRYTLKIIKNDAEKIVIEATCNLKYAALSGTVIKKYYTLNKNVARLDVLDKIWALKKRVAFRLNIHNLFSGKAFEQENLFFYMPSKKGMVRFSMLQAKTNRHNIIYDPSQAWMAVVAPKAKFGIAVLVEKLKGLKSMYVWSNAKNFTIEPTFNQTVLKPIEGADQTQYGYSFMPLSGVTTPYYVTNNLVYGIKQNGKNSAITLYFPVAIGAGTVSIEKNSNTLVTKKISGKTGTSETIDFNGTTGGVYTVLIKTTGREIKSLFTLKAARKISYVAPQTKLKKKSDSGINGYYYYYDDFWITKDFYTRIAFGIAGDFSKKRNLRIELTMPAGVDLIVSKECQKNYKVKTIKREGKTWKVHSFSGGRTKTYFGALRELLFKAKSNFNGPAKIIIKTVWDGGSLPSRTRTIREVEFPKQGPKFKHLLLGLTHNSASNDVFPDYVGFLTRAGFNFVEMWDYVPVTILTKHLGNGAYSHFTKSLSKAGITAAINIATVYPYHNQVLDKKKFFYDAAQILFHPSKRKNPFDPEKIKAVDLNGKRVHAVCPSYRGAFYQKGLDDVKTGIDYGFINFMYDEESYNNGLAICFCTRCKAQFKKYLATHFSNLSYKDPQIFAKNTKQYSKLNEAWWQFKLSLLPDAYKGVRELMDSYKNGKARKGKLVMTLSRPDDKGEKRVRLTSLKEFSKISDYIVPMIYTPSPVKVRELVKKTVSVLGHNRALPGITLAPNHVYENSLNIIESQNLPSRATIRYQVVESYFAGARIVYLWQPNITIRGASGIREVTEGALAIAPIEDILWAGKTDKNVKSSLEDVYVSAYRKGNKVALMLSEYSNDIMKTTITCPVKQPSQVIELPAGKVIAEISVATPTFSIKLTKNRNRVFLIKPR